VVLLVQKDFLLVKQVFAEFGNPTFRVLITSLRGNVCKQSRVQTLKQTEKEFVSGKDMKPSDVNLIPHCI